MRVELIAVPYDSGRRGERMGAGTEHLLAAGLADELSQAGLDFGVSVVEMPTGSWTAEVHSAFHLARLSL